jgi:hypothetical protein
VHVEAHLLDHISNVRPGEGEVLKSPSQTVVSSRVADGPPHVRGTKSHVLLDGRASYSSSIA